MEGGVCAVKSRIILFNIDRRSYSLQVLMTGDSNHAMSQEASVRHQRPVAESVK